MFTINLINATSEVYSNKMDLNATVNNNSMNMYLTIKEQQEHPFLQIELFMQSPDSGRYDMELVNRTIDECKLFENRSYEPLIQIIYGIILEHGKFARSCPIKSVRS